MFSASIRKIKRLKLTIAKFPFLSLITDKKYILYVSYALKSDNPIYIKSIMKKLLFTELRFVMSEKKYTRTF